MAELPIDLQIVLEFEAIKHIASHKSPGTFLEFYAVLQQDGGKLNRDALMIFKHVENIYGFLGGLDEDTQVKDLSSGTVFDLFASIGSCAADMATLDAPRNWGVACRQIIRAIRRIQELLQPFLLAKEVAASSTDVAPFAVSPPGAKTFNLADDADVPPSAAGRQKKRVSFAEPIADERLIPGIADLLPDPEVCQETVKASRPKESMAGEASSVVEAPVFDKQLMDRSTERRVENSQRLKLQQGIERAQQEAAEKRGEEPFCFATGWSEWSEWSGGQSCNDYPQYNWYADSSEGSWGFASGWSWDQSQYDFQYGCSQYKPYGDHGSWNWAHCAYPSFPTAAGSPFAAAAAPKIEVSSAEPVAGEALRQGGTEAPKPCAEMPAVENTSMNGSEQKLLDVESAQGSCPLLPAASAESLSTAAAAPKIEVSSAEPVAGEALRQGGTEAPKPCAEMPAVENTSMNGSEQKLLDVESAQGSCPLLPAASAESLSTAAAAPKIEVSSAEPVAGEALRQGGTEAPKPCAEMPAVENTSMNGSEQKLLDVESAQGSCPLLPAASAESLSTAAAAPKIEVSSAEPVAGEALRQGGTEAPKPCAEMPAVENTSMNGSEQKLLDVESAQGSCPLLPAASAESLSTAAAAPKIEVSSAEPVAGEALRQGGTEAPKPCAEMPAVENTSMNGSEQKLLDVESAQGSCPLLPAASAESLSTAAAAPKIEVSSAEPVAGEALRQGGTEAPKPCTETPAVENTSMNGSEQKLLDVESAQGSCPLLPAASAESLSTAAAGPKIEVSSAEPVAGEALRQGGTEAPKPCAEMPTVEKASNSSGGKRVSFVEPAADKSLAAEDANLAPNPQDSQTVKASPKILKKAPMGSQETMTQPFGEPFAQPLAESRRYRQLKDNVLRRCKHSRDRRGFAMTLHDMGKEMQLVGDIPLAREHFEDALRRRRLLYEDKDHFEVAATLHSLGQVIRRAGDPVLAKQHLEESLRMKRALCGDKRRPGIAATLHELGHVNHDLGDLMPARQYLEEALQMRRSLYGDTDHAEIAETLRQLALANHDAGDVVQGKQLMDESLRMIRSVHGNRGHGDVAATLYASGRMHQGAGDLTLAKQQLEECLHMKKYHEKNDSYATQRLLAQVCHASGDFEGVKQHLKEVVYSLEPWRCGVPDPPQLAPTLHELAQVCLKTGDVLHAERHFQSALTATIKLHGEKDHPDVATILLSLGKMALQAGELVEAKRKVEKSLQMNRSLHGQRHHPDIAEALGLLGQLSQKNGDVTEARKHFEECVCMKRSLQNGDHPVTAELGKLGHRGGA